MSFRLSASEAHPNECLKFPNSGVMIFLLVPFNTNSVEFISTMFLNHLPMKNTNSNGKGRNLNTSIPLKFVTDNSSKDELSAISTFHPNISTVDSTSTNSICKPR